MTTDCTLCGATLGANNKSGYCGNCRNHDPKRKARHAVRKREIEQGIPLPVRNCSIPDCYIPLNYKNLSNLCLKHYRQTEEYRSSGVRSGKKWRTKNLMESVRLNPDGPGRVYLVRSRWAPDLVKIGCTRGDDVRKRLSLIGFPDLEIVAVWREDPPWSLEKFLHAHFEEHRIDGKEWFQVPAERVVAVVEWLALQNFHQKDINSQSVTN